MPYKVYAMDTYFYNTMGNYDFDARCEMLRELGYDGTYLTLWSQQAWDDLPKLAHVQSKHGLEVAGVYATLDITAGDQDGENQRILRLVESVEGCRHVELAIKASDVTLNRSDEEGDVDARVWLERLLEPAAKRGITIALYPHINQWLERLDDAARLCRKIHHPNLGAVFTGYHWYAVDGKNLWARLEEAGPYLRSANLCGSRKVIQGKDTVCSIETLDQGELDNFTALGLLKKTGYKGMVGFQGYGLGGDAYGNLKRSLTAFRDMEKRLEAHPHWGELR